jgi:hypothetical protein
MLAGCPTRRNIPGFRIYIPGTDVIMKYLIFCSIVLLSGCSYFRSKPVVILPDPEIVSAEVDDPMAPSLREAEEKPELKVVKTEGDSYDSAILVTGARGRLEKLTVQQDILTERLGTEGTDWEITDEKTERAGSKQYDIITIRLLKDDSTRTFYFDTTDFYENI